MFPRPDRQPYVLVVEDDAALRELYRNALHQAGFAVIAVDDGLTALRRLEVERPAAVVLDLELPRLGGRDVHKELQARRDMPKIPIVVVTGGDTTGLDPRDFACILRKPISPDELVAAVERCCKRK